MAVPWPHEVIKIESTGESDWICSCTRIKGSYLIDHNGCKIPLVVKSNGRTIVDLENATGGLENASISIMGTQINLAQRRNLARIEIFPEENTPVIYILADKKEGKSLSIIFLSEAIRP